MDVTYPKKDDLERTLCDIPDSSLHMVVLVTAALFPNEPEKPTNDDMERIKTYLNECTRILKNGGLLFVQGRPDYLPELGVYLDDRLDFKYWIAVESAVQQSKKGLPSVHAAILLFTKRIKYIRGSSRFNIKRTRFPHQYCTFCHKTLKDWGGKAHLMNPDGYVISDIWQDLPSADNYTQISRPVLDALLKMPDFQEKASGLVAPQEGIDTGQSVAEPVIQYMLPGLEPIKQSSTMTLVEDKLFNTVHLGDAISILKQYPDNCIDLAFADPPYNLDKAYHVYDDERANQEYIAWCNEWLQEYVRILKPTGSLYVLNLPRWTMHHATFLNQQLYFQNWIVWDALSEPRGKLMPAHYGLLFYTKHPTNFVFNYQDVGQLDARYYCLRTSCIRQRKAIGADDKMLLTDIWWDIHRIKHQRDRDYHPCQLPEALMERIIRLSTNEGDVVLDALCGTGTTPVTALKLGRRYVAIDLDERYIQITKEKIAQVEQNGTIQRISIHRLRKEHTKKELQLELRRLTAQLGRLPMPQDVQELSKYDLDVFLDTFSTWGKALKAAKLEVRS